MAQNRLAGDWMELILRRLDSMLEIALCLLMAGLMTLAFLQVVLRYVFGSSLFWAEEVILFAFTWIIFLAAAVNLERGAHFGVDILVDSFPKMGRQIIQGLMQLGIGVILCVFVWVGFRFAVGAWVQESDILRVPKTVLYISLPLSACMMLLLVVRNLLRLVRGQSLKAEAEEL
jgi:TRAP-type C4-dicarboxylate transport system permease small subunit